LPGLDVEHRAAPFGHSLVPASFVLAEGEERLTDARRPVVGHSGWHLLRGNRPLEALVGREEQQIAELEPGAEHPEPGVGQPEKAERGKAHPVRSHDHAERARVERFGEVLEKAGLCGHLRG
jgi:hypothetical protein